jgi:hypothetical protein
MKKDVPRCILYFTRHLHQTRTKTLADLVYATLYVSLINIAARGRGKNDLGPPYLDAIPVMAKDALELMSFKVPNGSNVQTHRDPPCRKPTSVSSESPGNRIMSMAQVLFVKIVIQRL